MADYWLKLYVEILDDPKMMKLSDDLFSVIVKMFLYVKSINTDGSIPSVEDAAWKLHMQPEKLSAALAEIEQATAVNGKPGVIHMKDGVWFIANFAKRQGPSPVTERVERHRNKQRKVQYYGNEPVTDRYTEADTEADTDTEAEAEGGASDSFSEMQHSLERLMGLPIVPNKTEIDAINEMVKIGVIEDDIRAAIQFFKDKGITARGASGILNSVKYAVSQRVQSVNGKKPASTKKEKAYTEVY